MKHRLEQQNNARIGIFIPRCDESNADLYKSLQCHGSTGYCWCVDIVTGKQSNQLEPFRLWEMSSVDVDLETLCN